MLFLKILLVALLGYLLLYWLVPKGVFIYEGLRLPAWAYRMETFPSNGCRREKYAYGKHPRQYLLFFRPEKNVKPKNHVIVYFHGGGWQFGRPEMFKANAQTLTDQGYSVFMPSHRRIPLHDIEDLREDSLSALSKVLEILKTEGMEEKKIIIGGISSGGNLAALLVFDRSILQMAKLPRQIFAGIFLLGAPLNLEGMWKSPPLRMLAGQRNGELFKKANPYCHLQPGEDIPTFILHGEKDGLVELSSVVSFFEKMKALGAADVQLKTLPDGNHLDAASWCFEHHPSHLLLLNWLGKFEDET